MSSAALKDEVVLEIDDSLVRQRLTEIAAEIRKGANPEGFQAELDVLLGTTMEDRDRVADGVWEHEYRGELE